MPQEQWQGARRRYAPFERASGPFPGHCAAFCKRLSVGHFFAWLPEKTQFCGCVNVSGERSTRSFELDILPPLSPCVLFRTLGLSISQVGNLPIYLAFKPFAKV